MGADGSKKRKVGPVYIKKKERRCDARRKGRGLPFLIGGDSGPRIIRMFAHELRF